MDDKNFGYFSFLSIMDICINPIGFMLGLDIKAFTISVIIVLDFF